MTDSEKIIRTLYRISLDHAAGFDKQVADLLDLGRERFNLEIAILAQIRGQEYVVEHCRVPADVPLSPRDVFDLGRTYCAETMAVNGPVGLENVGASEFCHHPAYADFRLESYLGTPVVVDGRVYGTLNFSSPLARPRTFGEVDYDALQLMSAWLGGELGRLHREDQVRGAEERFRLALDASPGAMVITDLAGVIVHVNLQALELFDYSFEQIVGRSVDILLPEGLRMEHSKHRKEYEGRPTRRAMGAGRELTALNSQGNEFPVEVGLNPLEMPNGTYILGAVTDLTERKRYETQILAQAEALKRANRKLAEQATEDSLTGTLNRRGFASQLEAVLGLAKRGGHATSALMIDIDHFKAFNDAHGHGAGDKALAAVAKAIRDIARKSDVVCRYGGEEFLVLLPETGPEGAALLGERIRQGVSELVGLSRSVTISVGVATRESIGPTQSRGTAGTDLMLRADKALYRAKEDGRNRVVEWTEG